MVPAGVGEGRARGQLRLLQQAGVGEGRAKEQLRLLLQVCMMTLTPTDGWPSYRDALPARKLLFSSRGSMIRVVARRAPLYRPRPWYVGGGAPLLRNPNGLGPELGGKGLVDIRPCKGGRLWQALP